MKKKVLVLASVASMIDQFNMSNIDSLLSLGYEVHVACNFEKGNTCTEGKIGKLKIELNKLGVHYYQIDFTRSIFNIIEDIKAYKQVEKIMVINKYEFIHCHSPIGGAIGRLACKSTKTKCIYTAHGFHFYNGAPLVNWLIFYPIEKFLSKYTDVLITINKEDYNRAKTKFNMKRLEYVPGVGIDLEKFQSDESNRLKYRENLGLNDDDFAILSVGELNENKNHETIIKVIAKMNNLKIHYFVVGQGDLKLYLSDLANSLEVSSQVHLLGFRKDVDKLCNCVDLYILPSLREGLNVSLMEAMASGLPCIAFDIRGNNDLIQNKINGFLIRLGDEEALLSSINDILSNRGISHTFSNNNLQIIKDYSINKVLYAMNKIYKIWQ